VADFHYHTTYRRDIGRPYRWWK